MHLAGTIWIILQDLVVDRTRDLMQSTGDGEASASAGLYVGLQVFGTTVKIASHKIARPDRVEESVAIVNCFLY